jgi:GTP cyclohydrolase I
MSEKGAHNQRCRVQVDAESPAGLPYLRLLDAIEASGSCRIFPVLKRPDEKWVTDQAYARPAFVEDIARDALLALGKLPAIGAIRVEVQSQESIHPHDAYAVAEKPE